MVVEGTILTSAKCTARKAGEPTVTDEDIQGLKPQNPRLGHSRKGRHQTTWAKFQIQEFH